MAVEMKALAARLVDYRLERLPILDHPEAHLTEVLERLTQLGREGWRVVSVDLTDHPSDAQGARAGVAVAVLGEKPAGAVRPVEYRIERMPFQAHPETHLGEVLDRVTALGKEGWQVVSVDLTHHPSYSPAAQPAVPLPMLLMRET